MSSGTFETLDWLIVFGVLGATTLLGLVFGRQATIRDFFLGGRRLPWWAVSASIIATEISAVTLVSVPFIVFKPGGNFAYLQIVLIGSVLARLAIAWWLVPVYYEREIYSPYDYMGAKLGRGVRGLTTALFSFGGMLSQAARVYLTALVLEVVLHGPLARLSEATHLPTLALSIAILTIFAVLWTWIGGIVAVVWTDFLLFFVFTASAVVALVVIAQHLDLGFERLWRVGVDAHKVDFFDFDTSPVKKFTFWSAAIASSWGGIASYGVDQLMAQRLFCCRSVRDARLALVTSSIGVVVPVLVAFVGVGLFAYYERHPMTPEAFAQYSEHGERLLPMFVTSIVPTGLKGLIVAGIFAAAISSLDGILTALAQTTITALYLPWRQRSAKRLAVSARPSVASEETRSIRASRLLVLAFGVAMALLAYAMNSLSQQYGSVLELALSMATYTQGALLAGFALAYFAPRSGGSGFMWSAPLSVACVFAIEQHGDTARIVCALFGAAFALAWFLWRTVPDMRRGIGLVRVVVQLAFALLAAGALVWVERNGLFAVERDTHADPEWLYLPLAFPWYIPIGSTVAFVLGIVWSRVDATDAVAATSDSPAR